MKNRFLQFAKGLLVLFITISTFVTLAQDPKAVSSISLAPDVSGLAVGDIVHASLRITTKTGPNVPIASAVFYIDYNQTVLAPLGPSGFTMSYPGIYTYNPYFGSYGNNRLYLSFETVDGSNKNFNNVQLVTLDFIYLGSATSTVMHLRHSPDVSNLCAFFDYLGNQVAITNYTDKTISGDPPGTYYDLHSYDVGGPFDWFDPNSWVEGITPTVAANVFITGEEVQALYNDPSFFEAPKCHNLTIYPAGQLTINPTYPLSVGGDLIIQSDATSTGSLIDWGTGVTVAGTTTVERYYTGNWPIHTPPTGTTIFHYTSSPLSAGTANTFYQMLLSSWKESTQTWMNIVPETTPLVVGTGYSTATTSNGVLTFVGGHLNTGNKAITGLTRTTSTPPNNPAFDGFNLIGNPYASAVQYKNTWMKSNLTGSIYVWDPTTGNYKTTTGNLGGTLPDDIIPAEQAFFVRVTSGTGSITIPNLDRVHAVGTFYKNNLSDILYLKIDGNGYQDAMVVRFDPTATEGFDNDLDAYKLDGMADAPQLFSLMNDNTRSSINVLPATSSTRVISLGFKAGVAGTYVINASQLESFTTTDVFLEDRVTGSMVKLNDSPSYSFTASAGESTDRFKLHFGPVGISDKVSDNLKIYSVNKDIFVNIESNIQGDIIVYNLLGNEIASKTIVGNSLNKISLSVPTGYYLVKVISSQITTTSKVFIR